MATAPHNFSRVSARDAIAFGSSRPGFPSKEVTRPAIGLWVDFIKSNGIHRVISLLGDDEAADYYPDIDLDAEMAAAFGPTNYARTSVFVDGARDIVVAAIKAAHEAAEPVVVHCSGGEGRAAIGMALWLVDTYGLAPEDAAREVEDETARNEGVARRVNVAKLVHFVTNGSMQRFSK